MLQRQENIAAALLVRIKYCHFNELKTDNLKGLRKQLLDTGFKLVDEMSDGFIESYEHPEMQNKNKNTLVAVSTNEHLLSIKFLLANPE